MSSQFSLVKFSSVVLAGCAVSPNELGSCADGPEVVHTDYFLV